MRFLLLLVLLPVAVVAQVNRSARELAMENAQEYMTTKLLKGHSYKSVDFGQLKSYTRKDGEKVWLMEHHFETGSNKRAGQETSAHKTGKVFFYFDERMEIVRADSDDLY